MWLYINLDDISIWGQSLSHVWFFVTPWTSAQQPSLSITSSWNLLKLMSIESVVPSNHLIPVLPFSSHLQSFPASGSFQMNQSFTIRWPRYWSFSYTISPSNEHPGLISFRMDWLISLQSKGLSRVSGVRII